MLLTVNHKRYTGGYGDGDSYGAANGRGYGHGGGVVSANARHGCGGYRGYVGHGDGMKAGFRKFNIVNASGEGPLIWSLIRCY